MRIAGLVAALAAATLGGALAQDAIAQRQANFKRMNEIMTSLRPVAQSQGDPRPFVNDIRFIQDWSHGIPNAFPPGSDQGVTKARPAVWSDRATFNSRAADFAAQVPKMLAAAEAGDGAAFAREYAATGQACSACHRSFRER